VSVAGTYTLVVTGANGCTSQASAVVELDNAAPGAQATGGTLTCTVTSIQLQGSGNGSFAWSGPNGFASNAQNPTVSVAGTYTLVVTGANGCSSQASAVVELDSDAPGAQATGGTLTCTVTSIQLQGSGNGSFAWSGPNGFTSNEQNPTVSEAGTYTLVVTGANGCSSQASAVVVSDMDVPEVFAEGGMLPCEDGTVILSAFTDGTAPTYSWTGPNGYAGVDQYPEVAEPGIYVVVVTTANGCSGSTSVVVTREDCGEKECPALITNCPADITVDCAADYSPEGLGGMPTFRTEVDGGDKKCMPVKNHGWWDETLSACPFVIRRTFWAVDLSGDVAFCEQTITVVDETGPVIMGIPEVDGITYCDELEYYHLPTVWAFDECTESAMEATVSSVQNGDEKDGAYSITYTWTATDYCGNSSAATWTLFVQCGKPGQGKKLEVSASPNPFRNECVISLQAKETGTAVVTITDMQGRWISEAYNGPVYAGETTRVVFSPEKVGTGAFLYHVRMDGEQTHGRLMHQP
jgi:hypothetical protein